MSADEVSSTGGWFWWWAFAGWTFPSLESLKCYHLVSRDFRTNLLPIFSVDVEAKLAVNPKVNTKRWENELQTLNVVCGSIGWRWSNRHHRQSSIHFRHACSTDLQPFCEAESGLECKAVGPASTCFCGHRFGAENHHLIGQCPVNAVASQVSRAHLGGLSRDQAERKFSMIWCHVEEVIAICHVILRVLVWSPRPRISDEITPWRVFLTDRKLKCKMAGCTCHAFSYVPVKGSGDLHLGM